MRNPSAEDSSPASVQSGFRGSVFGFKMAVFLIFMAVFDL